MVRLKRTTVQTVSFFFLHLLDHSLARDGKVYIFNTASAHWNTALKTCQQNGARLASILSEVEYNALQDFKANLGFSVNNYWIGLHKSAPGFVWGDCASPDATNFSRWADGELQGPHSCVQVLKSDTRWRSVSCDNNAPFVCEKSTGPCTFSLDVDNTGYSDQASSLYSGADPLVDCQSKCNNYTGDQTCEYIIHTQAGMCYLHGVKPTALAPSTGTNKGYKRNCYTGQNGNYNLNHGANSAQPAPDGCEVVTVIPEDPNILSFTTTTPEQEIRTSTTAKMDTSTQHSVTDERSVTTTMDSLQQSVTEETSPTTKIDSPQQSVTEETSPTTKIDSPQQSVTEETSPTTKIDSPQQSVTEETSPATKIDSPQQSPSTDPTILIVTTATPQQEISTSGKTKMDTSTQQSVTDQTSATTATTTTNPPPQTVPTGTTTSFISMTGSTGTNMSSGTSNSSMQDDVSTILVSQSAQQTEKTTSTTQDTSSDIDTLVPPSSSTTELTETTTLSSRETTEEQTTTSSYSPSYFSSEDCLCSCMSSNFSEEEKLIFINNILASLSINTRATSAHVRTLTSAPDSRTSAQAMGYTGLIVLTTVFGGIVLLDLSTILNDIRMFKNNIKAIFPKQHSPC